jgi:hypothetical protein
MGERDSSTTQRGGPPEAVRIRIGNPRRAQVEIDVGTFEEGSQPTLFSPNGNDGGVAVAAQTYAPPAPPISGEVSFADPDLFEVRVYKDEGG